MTTNQETDRTSLPSVLVLGGGRWARVIVDVLLTIVSDDTSVQMASPSGAGDLAQWLEATGRKDRVMLVERDEVDPPPGSAVLVANAAESHLESALWALTRRLPVLVEKPMALTGADVRRLRDGGARRDTLVAPALVFRFSHHLDSFCAALERCGMVERVELVWVDPAAEWRHGSPKRYDAGISVLEDCIPHAFSIFDRAFGASPTLENLAIGRGGAKVLMMLSSGTQMYDLVLERNGAARQRILRAFGRSGVVELDFSIEPGTLLIDGATQPAAPTPRDGPLAAMMRAFFLAVNGGPIDPRLTLDTALHAGDVTDMAMAQYRECLASLLGDRLLAGPDLDYAVAELLQRPGRLDGPQFEVASAELRLQLERGLARRGWADIEAAVYAARDLTVTSGAAH